MTVMLRRRKLVAGIGLCSIAVLAIHNVPSSATQDDQRYSKQILVEAGYPAEASGFGDPALFESQIKAIAAVQDAVIKLAKKDEEIPFDRTREPRDLFELKQGLCYDRSRVIEKLLVTLGFEVRHVAVYATGGTTALGAILTPGNSSHALSEVKTLKGWMAVDPNVRWLGLTPDRRPLTVAAVRGIGVEGAQWATEASAPPHPIFSGAFVFVRGLYSRHGRFYPPYSPIPDVNWLQLAQNFTS